MGKLIVIDGLDGSGKATQTELLFNKIKETTKHVVKLSFPNYANDSSILVKMYLSGKFGNNPSDVNAYAASSFYAIDRYVSYKKYWEQLYLSDYTIICDRYVTSNLIHQMLKLPRTQWNQFIDWIEDYEYDKLELPKPDKVIYLDLDIKISNKLIDERYSNNKLKRDIHEKNLFYLKKCQEAARYLSNLKHWHIIKCCDIYGNIYNKNVLNLKILENIK